MANYLGNHVLRMYQDHNRTTLLLHYPATMPRRPWVVDVYVYTSLDSHTQFRTREDAEAYMEGVA